MQSCVCHLTLRHRRGTSPTCFHDQADRPLPAEWPSSVHAFRVATGVHGHDRQALFNASAEAVTPWRPDQLPNKSTHRRVNT